MQRFHKRQGESMTTASTSHLIIATLIVLLAAGLAGCDDSRLRGMDNNSESSEQGQGSTAHDDDHDEAAGGDESTEHPVDEHGHGIDPATEGETLEAGFMNGSWRVAGNEQDTPVAYFDTFQDEGDSRVDGTYLMAIGISEYFDGKSGNLSDASFQGNELVIKWNPTDDQSEQYTLRATRVDDDTLEGQITAQRNTALDMAVTATRRHTE